MGKVQDVLKGNRLTVASLWSQFGGSSLFSQALKCFLSSTHELKCFDGKDGLSHMLLSAPESRQCAFHYGKENELDREVQPLILFGNYMQKDRLEQGRAGADGTWCLERKFLIQGPLDSQTKRF